MTSPLSPTGPGTPSLRQYTAANAAGTGVAVSVSGKDRSGLPKYTTPSTIKQQIPPRVTSHGNAQQPADRIQPADGSGAADALLPAGPTAAMHWSRITLKGSGVPPPLRAHTTTVVGSRLFVFAGCDASVCFADLYVLDTETLWWSKPKTTGAAPLPCRAHSASLIMNRYLVVFGGGDGPNYYSSLHVLDTVTMTWHIPATSPGSPTPSARRAHTAFVYNSDLYIYAGGDGVRALSDLYILNTSILSPTNPSPVLTWTALPTKGTAPANRGYHTTNLIRNTPHVILYGGSDGHECFSSIHILNIATLTWTTPPAQPPPPQALSDFTSTDAATAASATSPPRLSHTATQIGSYLFIFGGHDGSHYNNTILLLNLVTMSWESRSVAGRALPAARGYHTAVLCDSRLWLYGGYDGQSLFGDCWVLELGASAYLPQITSFEVGGTSGNAVDD
ncbi:hypothetical protein HDU90_001649 [Geranomyces variabilis]|nr:hypothetical protein HDU90_001649 [Geranomyces variabilis]